MTNINRTKESIQNILIFFTDAIAIVLSYYVAGIIWLGLYWEMNNRQILVNLIITAYQYWLRQLLQQYFIMSRMIL